MNTSINLYNTVADEITLLSEESGLSESEIVRRLISKIKKFKSMDQIKGVLVEYQDRFVSIDEKGNKISLYEKVHYCPNECMVDYTKLLRFKYRISISKLVFASFLFFWEEIINEIYGTVPEEKIISYEKIVIEMHVIKKYFIKRLNLRLPRRE